mgnify:CR=1 FL=1
MESDCKYLFVYGTLLSHNNGYASLLKNNSRFIAEGSLNGLLYDIGEYPGARYDPAAAERIYGDVLLLNNDADVLTDLDDYEGYGHSQSQPNEFIRVVLPVHTASGIINCQVYLYNLPVTGYRQITSGKYNP